MPRRSSSSVTAPPRFTAWSISRYLDYGGPDGCPLRAKLRHLDKVDQGPTSDAMVRGREIHQEGDKWLSTSRRGIKLPASYAQFKDEMASLKKNLVVHEANWAMTATWQPTGYYDKDVWCRVRCDAVEDLSPGVVRVIDFKTGKFREHRMEEYRLQLELYAVAAVATSQSTFRVVSELWYLDQGIIYGGEEDGYVYEGKRFGRLRDDWTARVKPMLLDRTFRPRPGDYCRFCPYAKERGGQCRY